MTRSLLSLGSAVVVAFLAVTGVAQTNTPPEVEALAPPEGASFVDPATGVGFEARDDDLLFASERFLINGVGPTSGWVAQRRVDERTRRWGISSVLKANREYTVEFTVADQAGQKGSARVSFDTFSPTNVVMEAEDYDFGGGFLDAPVVWPLGETHTNAYNLRAGVAGVDYGELGPASPDGNRYRPDDPVNLAVSHDYLRPRFTTFDPPDAEIADFDVAGIRRGEWLNFTRQVPTGVYQVYLRQWLELDQSRARLEARVGETGAGEPVGWPLGAFKGTRTGAVYRNVAMTDATGERALPVRLGGRVRWRLVQETDDPSGESWRENYLVLVPVAEPVKVRPALTRVTPLPGAALDGAYPVIRAVLSDGDTGLDPASLRLEVGGQPVPVQVERGPHGWSVVGDAAGNLTGDPATVQARLVSADTEGVLQTNTWSFTVRNVAGAVGVDAAERVEGTFAAAADVELDPAGRVMGVPLAGGHRFYRLRLEAAAPCTVRIVAVRVEDGRLRWQYEVGP